MRRYGLDVVQHLGGGESGRLPAPRIYYLRFPMTLDHSGRLTVRIALLSTIQRQLKQLLRLSALWADWAELGRRKAGSSTSLRGVSIDRVGRGGKSAVFKALRDRTLG